jgi:hypothetical protein
MALGVVGTLIALSALIIAFLQLRKTRKVHRIYELA